MLEFLLQTAIGGVLQDGLIQRDQALLGRVRRVVLFILPSRAP